MIIINGIKIKNFLSHEDTKINFPSGVTVIVGPNGSGKTAIMDAIMHSLLGFRGVRGRASADELIRFGAKFMELELDFEADGKEYSLNWRRERGREASARLYCKQIGLITDSATKTVQEVIKIMDVDKDTLMNSIFIRQGEITSLIEEDPSERKRIVGRILGLDRFQKVYEKMHGIKTFIEDRKREYNSKINVINGAINNLINTINVVNERISNNQIRLSNMEIEIKGLEEELKRILVEKEIMDSMQIKYNELRNIKSEIEGRLNNINKNISNTESELKSCLNAKKELESMDKIFSRIPLLEKLIEVSNEIEKLKLSLKSLDEHFKVLNELENLEKQLNDLINDVSKHLVKPTKQELNYQINSFREKLNDIQSKIQRKSSERDERIGRIENLKHNIETIDQLDICPVCKTRLSPQHKEHVREEISMEINKLENEIKVIEEEISIMSKEKNEIERMKSILEVECSEKLGKIEFIMNLTINKRRDLLNRIPELKNLEFKIEDAKKLLNDRYKELNDVKGKYEFEMDNIIKSLGYNPINPKKELEDLRLKKEELHSKAEKYNILMEHLNNLISERNKLMDELYKISKSIDELGYSVEKHEEINRKYQLTSNELSKLKGTLSEVKRSLENDKQLLSQLNIEIELKNKDLKEIETCLNKVDNAIRVIEIIRKAYSSDGIQKLFRQRVAPLISQLATNYIDQFNLDITGISMDEDLDVKVSRGGDFMPLELLSGGEKVAVAVALRLALARALAERFSIVIMDEPTIHLDEERRRVLVNVFKNFRESTITQQMIIITHDRELEDVADTVFQVEKVNGVSKVKEVSLKN
ncbi:MAG: ATP-binding protein [Candidatus Methanomethylicia archaeon]